MAVLTLNLYGDLSEVYHFLNICVKFHGNDLHSLRQDDQATSQPTNVCENETSVAEMISSEYKKPACYRKH